MTIEKAVKVIKENIDVYEECIGTRSCLMMPIEGPDIEAFRIAIKALEQEPILDKIRAEIMSKDGLEEALEIIDKYMAESEE